MTHETILITGGAGNLARQLSDEFASAGHNVVLADLPPAAPDVPHEYHVVDISDQERIELVLDKVRPDRIVHFASLLSGQSEEDRARAWQVNMDGAFKLFEAALATGVSSIFFPSSVAAYGAPLPEVVPPDQPQWPTGLYGVTKACVERLGVYYHHRFGLDFRCLRLPVVVSRFAPPGAASAYASRCFVEAATTNHYTFRVRPETRPSLIYVKDVLRAVQQLITAPAGQLTRRVYNLQALSPTAGELCHAISKRIPGARLQFAPDAEVVQLIESWPVRFDDTVARNDWGWSPHFDLDMLADDFLGELIDGDADGRRLRGTG
jgi:threonine 3-dehydrogenase